MLNNFDEEIDEIIAAQGWNDDTVSELVRDFVFSHGLADKLRQFLKDTAEYENHV
jgi:hypothetical protein